MPNSNYIQGLHRFVLRTALLCLALNPASYSARAAQSTPPTPSDAEASEVVPLPPLEAMPTLDAGASPSDLPRERLPSRSPTAADSDSGDNREISKNTEAGESIEGATDSDGDNDNDNDLPTENELWQINTRHLPACCSNPTPRIYRNTNGCWQRSELSALLEPFDGVVVVFAHGNRMEPTNTLQRGMLYFRSLTACDGPKVRFIIWSWPSDQIKGQLKDVRYKAQRADCEGAYLGWFLEQLPAEQTVSLLGYSYGARVIANCMHLQARGGHRYFTFNNRRPMRVSLTAAAMSNRDLSSCGRYRNAMTLADRMLLLYNTFDPVLKRYHLVEPKARPEALGYTGLTRAVPSGQKIRQIDASPAIGKSHYEPRYLWNSGLAAEMRRCLLWQAMP